LNAQDVLSSREKGLIYSRIAPLQSGKGHGWVTTRSQDAEGGGFAYIFTASSSVLGFVYVQNRKHWLVRLPSASSALFAATLCGCSSSAPPTDLGSLSKPAVVTARDGGAAALVGGRMLWTFGDTLMTVTGADGFNYRSATAGWSSPGSLQLDEALDAAGAPFQLFPLTADEAAYNQAHGPTERYALWPGSVIEAPDGNGAWIFYQRLKIHPGALNYEALDVGLARLALGSTVAVRDPSPLFSVPAPAYALAAHVDEGFVYLYGCKSIAGQLDSECRVVRAAVADAASASAWKAYDGAAWQPDLGQAQPVLHGPPGDLSVSFNAYLGQFLAVYSGIFSNDIRWRSSPHPEGPWSTERLLFTTPATPSGNNYAGKEHPELAVDHGKTIAVSYAQPTGTFTGDVRLASVALP
jgi:hypothetical protein